MKRESRRNTDCLKQLQDDIEFLLSNIRARENGLIFFLQRFTTDCMIHEEIKIFKEEFMQKEKIYATQVARIVTKYKLAQVGLYEQQIRTFWIKVKSIVKVSLERLRILNLLNQKIFARYEEIIALINKNYDEQKGLEQFSSIQNLLKKRNVDALIMGKGHFSILNSSAKITKNRSQSTLKQSKYSPNVKQHDQIAIKLDFDLPGKETNEMRMKSLNRYRKKKVLMQNKVLKNSDKAYRRMAKSIEKYQKCFEGVMTGSIDYNYDKKKTIKENEENLYDQMFKNNIPNHKLMSKFIFGSCGIRNLIAKKPAKLKGKKILSKFDQKESKQFVKLNRSKVPMKQGKQRPQSSQNNNFKLSGEERRKMIQTMLTEKKGKFRKKAPGRIQKYQKLIKLIS